MSDDFETIDPREDAEFVPPPAWPKVIGVISMLFAGLGLVCGGLGFAFSVFGAGMVSGALEGDPPPPTMVFGPADYAVAGLGLVLSVLLLFAGIMLFGRRPIGRTLHLVYAVCAIPLNIFAVINSMTKQADAVQWAKDFPNNPIAQQMNAGGAANEIGQIVGLVLGLGLGVGVPLFYFVWFAAIKTKPVQITGTEDGVY